MTYCGPTAGNQPSSTIVTIGAAADSIPLAKERARAHTHTHARPDNAFSKQRAPVPDRRGNPFSRGAVCSLFFSSAFLAFSQFFSIFDSTIHWAQCRQAGRRSFVLGKSFVHKFPNSHVHRIRSISYCIAVSRPRCEAKV